MAAALVLVHGADYRQREAAIAAAISDLSENQKITVILEGLPDGQDLLTPLPQLHIHRIAPGCFCCIGNLTLRVTLNRALRTQPDHIFLALASHEHLDKLEQSLQTPPYNALLSNAVRLSL
ncbi:GTPase [Undibacterium sp. TJN19]|uniref:GTPase n=1 Tax=Undibacterium sp. TJN19 TaxID=3413055 RepID=UPI003BF40EE0